MPLVATSDPLPEAFAATLGRLLPLDGRVGVSLLLTFVIEIMSCFGLAALRAVGDERTREAQSVRETQGRPHIGGDPGIARDLIAPRRSSLRDRRGSSLDRPSRPPMAAFLRITTR